MVAETPDCPHRDEIQVPSSILQAFSLASSWIGSIMIVLVGVRLVLTIARSCNLYMLSQQKSRQFDFKERYGKWAVITGATDGIGLSIARELAKRGLSILAVSRNADKLAAIKAELEKIPAVGEIETVQIDLADSSADNFNRICTVINPDKRFIGVLVNNAGTYPEEPKPLNEFQAEEVVCMANLNMLNPLHMTRMIMPGMLARGKGLVINVSSVMGSVTSPYLSVYGPTKRFLDSFTRQLQAEYANRPVEIVLMKPGPVFTAHFDRISKVERPTWMEPSPDSFAKTAINAIAGERSCFTGWLPHELLLALVKFLEATDLSKWLLPAYYKLVVKRSNY